MPSLACQCGDKSDRPRDEATHKDLVHRTGLEVKFHQGQIAIWAYAASVESAFHSLKCWYRLRSRLGLFGEAEELRRGGMYLREGTVGGTVVNIAGEVGNPTASWV